MYPTYHNKHLQTYPSKYPTNFPHRNAPQRVAYTRTRRNFIFLHRQSLRAKHRGESRACASVTHASASRCTSVARWPLPRTRYFVPITATSSRDKWRPNRDLAIAGKSQGTLINHHISSRCYLYATSVVHASGSCEGVVSGGGVSSW